MEQYIEKRKHDSGFGAQACLFFDLADLRRLPPQQLKDFVEQLNRIAQPFPAPDEGGSTEGHTGEPIPGSTRTVVVKVDPSRVDEIQAQLEAIMQLACGPKKAE